MRLIDTSTLKLVWFPKDPPPYAIFSHTWGLDEVTFADFSDLSTRETKAGFSKIKHVCEQAFKDGFGYAWVDTCCINKESSSELSEAINCMFKWYHNAGICYAYLEDAPEDIMLPIISSASIKHCKWFTRGWTLQELLAPREVVFFGAKWAMVGRKTELSEILEQITGIPSAVLTGNARLDQISIPNRMEWVAKRQTTREEDTAYCLMGIFDVNMPAMYGEGKKAFTRLQEEILKQTSEELASEAPYRDLFASLPKEITGELSSLDNVYQYDILSLTLPQEMRLLALYPREHKEFEKTMRLPIANLIGNKVAFHLAVDRKASGADVFQQIGWGNEDEVVTNKEMNFLLLFWDEQTGPASFTYYIDVKTAKAEDVESKFMNAEKPLEALHKKEIVTGWSTLCITTGQTTLDGHQTLNLQLSVSVNQAIKTAAESVQSRMKANRIREQARQEKRQKAYLKRCCLCVVITGLVVLVVGVVVGTQIKLT